jgi:hypothetical protein
MLQALVVTAGALSIFKASIGQVLADVRQECDVDSIDLGALLSTPIPDVQTHTGSLYIDLDVSTDGHAVGYRTTDADGDFCETATIHAMLNGVDQGPIFSYGCDHRKDARSNWCVTTEPRESPCTYFISGQSTNPETMKTTPDQNILVSVEKYAKGILFKLGFANQAKKDASVSFTNKVMEFVIEHPSLDKAEVEVSADNHFRVFLPAHP